MICSNCKNEIEGDYYSICDNFLQNAYFDYEEENIFCSQECVCKYLSVELIENDEILESGDGNADTD